MKKVFFTICFCLMMGSVFASPIKIIMIDIITSCGVIITYAADGTETPKDIEDFARFADQVYCPSN